jgi:hypothetical protein
LLEDFETFASFVCGGRCAVVLPVGYDRPDRFVWARWQAPHQIFPCGRSWLAVDRPAESFGLFASFEERLKVAGTRDWLNLCLTLLHEANRTDVDTRLAIIKAQIALDLLASVLIEEPFSISLENQSARDRLRLLFGVSRIPTALPPKATALMALSPQPTDIADAIVSLRNAIVHPTKTKRSHLASATPRVLHETRSIAVTSAQLVLLSWFGYKGHYEPCMCVFDAARVPWVAKAANI